MKNIKSYKLFLESNFEFDFLANIGKMKSAILKIIEMHEKKCYNDNKISSYNRFQNSINDLIDASIKGENMVAEDYLSIVYLFEKEVYDNNLLKEYENSMFGIIDDLVLRFNNLLETERTEIDIDRFGDDIDHIINNIEDDWIYKNSEE